MLAITSKQWPQIRLSKYLLYRWEMHSHLMKKKMKKETSSWEITLIWRDCNKSVWRAQQTKGTVSLLFQTIPRHYFHFICEICCPLYCPCPRAACLVTQIQFPGIHVSLQAGFPGLLSLLQLNCSVKERRISFMQWNYQGGGFSHTFQYVSAQLGYSAPMVLGNTHEHQKKAHNKPYWTPQHTQQMQPQGIPLWFSLQKWTNIITAMWSLRLLHRPSSNF